MASAPRDGSAYGLIDNLRMVNGWPETVWPGATPPVNGSAFGLLSDLRIPTLWGEVVWPTVEGIFAQLLPALYVRNAVFYAPTVS